jgi:hypothetical protein
MKLFDVRTVPVFNIWPGNSMGTSQSTQPKNVRKYENDNPTMPMRLHDFTPSWVVHIHIREILLMENA